MDIRTAERHALMTRLLRLVNKPGEHAGGFTSWGEVITVKQEHVIPLVDGPVWLSPTWGEPEQAPKQLGFGHMDKIAQEMKP